MLGHRGVVQARVRPRMAMSDTPAEQICKLPAATTHIFQPLDVSPCFRSMKAYHSALWTGKDTRHLAANENARADVGAGAERAEFLRVRRQAAGLGGRGGGGLAMR